MGIQHRMEFQFKDVKNIWYNYSSGNKCLLKYTLRYGYKGHGVYSVNKKKIFKQNPNCLHIIYN